MINIDQENCNDEDGWDDRDDQGDGDGRVG